MDCTWIQKRIAAYADGDANAGVRWIIRRHLMGCDICFERYERRDGIREWISGLGEIKPPAALAVQLRCALSRELQRAWWPSWRLHLANFMRPLAIPATGGVLCAIMLLTTLMAQIWASPRVLGEDVPLTYLAKGWNSEPTMNLASPFLVSHDIVVEAFIDGAGSVYDFRVVSLPPQYPAGFPSLKTELANSLLTSRFEPATSFGLPVRGKVLISFRPGTHVTVQG